MLEVLGGGAMTPVEAADADEIVQLVAEAIAGAVNRNLSREGSYEHHRRLEGNPPWIAEPNTYREEAVAVVEALGLEWQTGEDAWFPGSRIRRLASPWQEVHE